MQASTYRDLIDDKIDDWLTKLNRLEEQAKQSSSEAREILTAKAKQIHLSIKRAENQLHQLDEQETLENTLETKDRILKVFSSVDKEFAGVEETSPFML